MLTQQDIDYLLKREAEERARASSSSTSEARDAHFGLAERYADAAASAEEEFGGPVRASGLWPKHDAPIVRADTVLLK